MKQTLSAIVMLFTAITISAQGTINVDAGRYCYNDNINNANINKFEPITVRVNAVTLHRDDGSGFLKLLGSDELSVEQSTLFMEYLDYVNYVYANFVQPDSYANCNYTGTEFFPDFKIRIKNNVLPISDTYFWNYKNSGADIEQNNTTGFTPSETWYMAPLDNIIHNSPNYPKGINSYFTHDGDIFDQVVANNALTWSAKTKAAGQSPSTTNLTRSSQTHNINRFLKYLYHKYKATEDYNTTWEETRYWHIGDARLGVGHELGHCFGLSHSPSGCDHNLMKADYAPDQHFNFLTPTQIRTVHDNLTKTNLIQFVTEDSYYDVGLRITQNQTWTGKRRIYSDLIIESGANLILKKDLIMAPQSVIYIRNGGTLTLDGGLILSADGENWGGLFKNPTGNFVITANTSSTELYANEYFVVTNNTTNKSVCGLNDIVIGGKTSEENWVNIYPNPSSGNVNLEFSDSHYIGGTITIMDQMNQQVFSEKINQLKDSLNLTNLQKGIYTVVFNKDNQILTKQLIIK